MNAWTYHTYRLGMRLGNKQLDTYHGCRDAYTCTQTQSLLGLNDSLDHAINCNYPLSIETVPVMAATAAALQPHANAQVVKMVERQVHKFQVLTRELTIVVL